MVASLLLDFGGCVLAFAFAFTPAFQNFQFAPNGVCLQPQLFVEFISSTTSNINKPNVFTMRNVPGDGDCMFLAVALAAATSMGLGGNDALLRAISRETREVVAQILSSPNGNLHIEEKRIVSARELLLSAAKVQGVDTDTYLQLLRKEGSQGGLYGGGPELTVLANVLRRPISIYELDPNYGNISPPQPNTEPANTDPTLSSLNDVEPNPSSPSPSPNPSPRRGDSSSSINIVCKGIFGKGLLEDPCASIPDSAVLLSGQGPQQQQPGAYSWHLNILVLDVSPTEKHACVLLPQMT